VIALSESFGVVPRAISRQMRETRNSSPLGEGIRVVGKRKKKRRKKKEKEKETVPARLAFGTLILYISQVESRDDI